MELLRQYLDLMERSLGLDVVIYDECRLLSMSPLRDLPQTGKWHLNPYCLKIKENQSLRNRCVRLKNGFVQKVLQGTGVVKSTCYCGVAEYVAPIRIDGCLVCMVAAVGFRGDLSEHMCSLLGQRVGLKAKQLAQLRERALIQAADEEAVIRAVEILARLIERYIRENTEIPTLLDRTREAQNEHVLRAMDYIGQNFAKPIDSAAVATHCHVNASYLQHLFSSALGHGIASEIRQCRLNYARELLCTTDYSVEYISYLCGFSSADYFSTAFKKHFGYSPLQFRKHYK